MFSARLDSFLPFSSIWKLSSANSFSLEEPKVSHLVMVKHVCAARHLPKVFPIYKISEFLRFIVSHDDYPVEFFRQNHLDEPLNVWRLALYDTAKPCLFVAQRTEMFI